MLRLNCPLAIQEIMIGSFFLNYNPVTQCPQYSHEFLLNSLLKYHPQKMRVGLELSYRNIRLGSVEGGCM